MVLIDLGELDSATPAEPVAARPRAQRRRLGVAAALAVVLATLAGGGPLAGPLPEATIDVRLGALTVPGPHRMFVLDPADGRTSLGGYTAAAFRLPDAGQLWRVPLPMAGPVGTVKLVAATLVVGNGSGSALPQQTIGLDAASGTVAWRRTAQFAGVTVHDDVLLWLPTTNPPPPLGAGSGRRPGQDPPAAPAGSAPSIPTGDGVRGAGTAADGTGMATGTGTGDAHGATWQELQAVDPANGAPVWSVRLPGRATLDYRMVDDRMAAVMVSLPDGEVQIRDVATGSTLRRATLPPPRPELTGRPTVTVVGDLLLISGGGWISGYGFDRLDRRWTIRRRTGEWGPWPCGDGLCLFGLHGGVRAVDRRTGRTRWTDRDWTAVHGLDDHLVATTSGRNRGAVPLSVLDVRSGRRLGDLGRWEVTARAGDRLIGIRFDAAGVRSVVAALDPTTQTSRVIAVLHGVSSDCEVLDDLVVCRKLDGAIGVWQLPARPL